MGYRCANRAQPLGEGRHVSIFVQYGYQPAEKGTKKIEAAIP
jgi:hypothetical protein